MRMIGRGIQALLILLGVALVSGSIDLIPYVGSPQFDYVHMDFSKPFWPQILGRTVPVAVSGAFVAVLCTGSFRGRFPEPVGLASILLAGIGWGLTALILRLVQVALWNWPLDGLEMMQFGRYAVINAIASATLIVGVQACMGRYARWRGRPSTRWSELALWFAISALAITAFLSSMAIVGGLSTSGLVSGALEMILVLGGAVALCAATGPRRARGSDAVGAEGLEPPTRPL